MLCKFGTFKIIYYLCSRKEFFARYIDIIAFAICLEYMP